AGERAHRRVDGAGVIVVLDQLIGAAELGEEVGRGRRAAAPWSGLGLGWPGEVARTAQIAGFADRFGAIIPTGWSVRQARVVRSQQGPRLLVVGDRVARGEAPH